VLTGQPPVRSTGEKVEEFLTTGKIGVLEEYKSGERGM
jgi:hypothetical protein